MAERGRHAAPDEPDAEFAAPPPEAAPDETDTRDRSVPAVPPADTAPTVPRRRRRDELPPAASLSPTDRVVPTWTDPTVRRAATLIGGPLGTHASVGRNRVFTPLRVVLVFALVALIVGWLAKSPCIQTGANGELDQGGQRPWITGCYNDIVPLYGSRGLDDAGRNPYSYTWVDNGPDQAAGVVYSRADVSRDGDSYLVTRGSTRIALGSGDLVYDAATGYQRVEDGELVTVPVSGGVTGDTTAPAGSPTVRYLEYPVLTGYFMWGAAVLTSGYLHLADGTGILPKPLPVGAYFSITAILLGLFYLWAVASTARMARRRIWDVAMLGLAPLLMLHAFTNWDLLAIGLTAAAMAAWSRQKPRAVGAARGAGWALTAGVLLGLGTAAKLYPGLLLGPLLVLCLRAGELRRFGYALGGAVAAWAAVNVPVMLSYPQSWGEFFSMNTARGPEWDSWYYLSTLIAPTSGLWTDPAGRATTLLNAGSLVLFLVACAAIGWLALAAARRPRFAQLAFLVVVAFLLTNKVFSPQYSLWLLPLVVLALPRWRPVLAWQLSEVAVWFLLMLSFDTDAGKNLSIHPFAVAATLRGALLIMLVVMVVRDILHPERDRVRIVGDDDPTGGVLDGAGDRRVLPSLPELLRRRRLARSGRMPAEEGAGHADTVISGGHPW
jgi:uncharacterized membrane protein